MKKNKKLTTLFISLLIITCLIMTFNWSKGYDDVNKCVVKYRYEWGQPCSQCKESSKTYTVYLRNECYKKLDTKCAVQETDKRWKTFTRLSMGYNDTIIGYACNGTGKYLYWTKDADDKSIVLPSDEEIQIIGQQSDK